MGLTLGTSVVVKELSEGGNAYKSGVRLGDQLFQVQNIFIAVHTYMYVCTFPISMYKLVL